AERKQSGSGKKFQIPNPKSQIPNSKFQIPNPKSQIPNSKSQISNTKTASAFFVKPFPRPLPTCRSLDEGGEEAIQFREEIPKQHRLSL
ncbi:MAG: hypothetical protein WBN18_08905, partial [Flavobacteriaceae bacterium]